MWHTILISVHAAAGGIAFLVGLQAMHRPGSLLRTFTGAVTVTALAVTAAIAVTWASLGAASRIVFVAFVVLAGYMVWRAVAATRILRNRTDHAPERYYDLLGFDLVALFDAFVVIALLDLGAPTWALVLTGVGIAVLGHFTLLRLAALRTDNSAERRPIRT